MKIQFLSLLSGIIFFSCQPNQNEFQITQIETPNQLGGEGNLFASSNNQLYLSWVKYLNDSTDALVFSKLENEKWNEPLEIARGSNWFVNWADFPSFVAYQNNENHLAAHWLQKSASGTYDYDVRIAQSKNGGKSWDESFVIHRDSIAAEHGFATLIPLSNNRIFATWLDGRNTKSGHSEEDKEESGHSHGGGAMTLRTAEFDIDGNLFEEAELDNKICDCCQTDAVETSEGMIVVYRDRSEHEIRDISIVRKVNGEWTKPHSVHADNWEITGCPVNGPAVDAIENSVAVTWFTSANGEASVKVSFSNDSGAIFHSPIKIDNGNPLGRVDIELISKGKALVTWLENGEEDAEIRAIEVHSDGTKKESVLLTKTSPSRASGFPILERIGEDNYLGWTDVNGEKTRVRTMRFNW